MKKRTRIKYDTNVSRFSRERWYLKLTRLERIAERVAESLFSKLGMLRGESLREFADRTGVFVGSEYADEIARILKVAWETAIKEAGKEVGVKTMFGPLEDRDLREIFARDDYDELFRKYSEYAADEVRDIINTAATTEMSYNDVKGLVMERLGVVESRGNVIARTEMQNIYSSAKAKTFERLDPNGSVYRYAWIGPADARRTDICTRITARSRHGVTREELLNIIRDEASMPGFTYDERRPFTPHFNCRHTFKVIT